MEMIKLFQAVFHSQNQSEDKPKRTLPIYYPLALVWRILKNGLQKSWKSLFLAVFIFLVVFAALFYLVNMEIKPAEKTDSLSDASFSGKVLGGDLKEKIGSTDVADLNYGEWATAFGLTSADGKFDDDPDADKLPNFLEYAHGTNPKNADTDGDGFSDRQEINNGFDPDSPGEAKPSVEITIKKIDVAVPMVWSTSEDENSMLEDLKSGVNHYPKSATPGQTGNMVISGHSSNYIWVKGDYNYIFKNLNNLVEGDMVDVKTIQQNGRVLTYHYKVNSLKKIVAPDDPLIFSDTAEPTLTLSTCWPLGTNFRRLIVKADLVK
ncbi:MAG: sortase [Parcubacteria group bacterium]|jgi:LPXTG-site transpeptidase (sortase) family protein